MNKLNESDYKIFERLAGLTQKDLKSVMSKFLRSKYKKVFETQEYIIAKGTIPIALVAHMDTVFSIPAKEVYYDTKKNVMWSPQGLGADDRAGIFSILQLVMKGHRPHIILTTDEEKGGLGASKLAGIKNPFGKELKYIIQLDRRGTNDCVFYDCENPEFTKYVEKFGFVESWGSFSDISYICPAWKVAGVNLSVGYIGEHSTNEILRVGAMLDTINKVENMLTEKEIPFFKYIPTQYQYPGLSLYGKGYDKVLNKAYFGDQYKYDYDYDDYDYGCCPKNNKNFNVSPREEDEIRCMRCGEYFLPEEVFPIDDVDGEVKWICCDCVADKDIEWCTNCGKPYVLENMADPRMLCRECEKKITV